MPFLRSYISVHPRQHRHHAPNDEPNRPHHRNRNRTHPNHLTKYPSPDSSTLRRLSNARLDRDIAYYRYHAHATAKKHDTCIQRLADLEMRRRDLEDLAVRYTRETDRIADVKAFYDAEKRAREAGGRQREREKGRERGGDGGRWYWLRTEQVRPRGRW